MSHWVNRLQAEATDLLTCQPSSTCQKVKDVFPINLNFGRTDSEDGMQLQIHIGDRNKTMLPRRLGEAEAGPGLSRECDAHKLREQDSIAAEEAAALADLTITRPTTTPDDDELNGHVACHPSLIGLSSDTVADRVAGQTQTHTYSESRKSTSVPSRQMKTLSTSEPSVADGSSDVLESAIADTPAHIIANAPYFGGLRWFHKFKSHRDSRLVEAASQVTPRGKQYSVVPDLPRRRRPKLSGVLHRRLASFRRQTRAPLQKDVTSKVVVDTAMHSEGPEQRTADHSDVSNRAPLAAADELEVTKSPSVIEPVTPQAFGMHPLTPEDANKLMDLKIDAVLDVVADSYMPPSTDDLSSESPLPTPHKAGPKSSVVSDEVIIAPRMSVPSIAMPTSAMTDAVVQRETEADYFAKPSYSLVSSARQSVVSLFDPTIEVAQVAHILTTSAPIKDIPPNAGPKPLSAAQNASKCPPLSVVPPLATSKLPLAPDVSLRPSSRLGLRFPMETLGSSTTRTSVLLPQQSGNLPKPPLTLKHLGAEVSRVGEESEVRWKDYFNIVVPDASRGYYKLKEQTTAVKPDHLILCQEAILACVGPSMACITRRLAEEVTKRSRDDSKWVKNLRDLLRVSSGLPLNNAFFEQTITHASPRLVDDLKPPMRETTCNDKRIMYGLWPVLKNILTSSDDIHPNCRAVFVNNMLLIVATKDIERGADLILRAESSGIDVFVHVEALLGLNTSEDRQGKIARILKAIDQHDKTVPSNPDVAAQIADMISKAYRRIGCEDEAEHWLRRSTVSPHTYN